MAKAPRNEAPKHKTVRTHLLEDANRIITKDRAATHGDAENSFHTIANYWSVYLSAELKTIIVVNPRDVAQMMVLFKAARAHNNPGHSDNWIDQIGYSAIAGEIALRGNMGSTCASQVGSPDPGSF